MEAKAASGLGFDIHRAGILALGGFIAIDRRHKEQAMRAIDQGAQSLRTGHSFLIFPEGTRRRKGLVKKYQPRPHSGAARIALEAGVPLVPAAIAGTDGLLRLERLRVRYGRPLEIDAFRERDPGTSLAKRPP